MASIPSLLDDPDSYDTLVVGGEALPGIVRVKDPETGRDFDIKKAKGKKKATITNNGDPPREWTVEWDIDPAIHWEEFLRLWPTLQPRKDTKELQPLELVHPIFALHDFKTALVKTLKGPSISRGLHTFELTFLEKEKPSNAAGVSGVGKGGGAAQADWNLQKLALELEVVEAELAQLKAERGGIIASGNAGASILVQIDARISQLQLRRQQLLSQMNKPNSNPNNNA